MKYMIALFFLYPGGKLWDYKVLDTVSYPTELACELAAQAGQVDGTLSDGTLVIHNCIKD